MRSYLISLSAAADSSVPLRLAVGVGAARVLRAGIRVTTHERVTGVPGRTAANGAVTLVYGFINYIQKYVPIQLGTVLPILQKKIQLN